LSEDVRRDKREKTNQAYTIAWEEHGLTRSIAVKASDVSFAGVGIRSSTILRPGTRVYIEAQNSSRKGYGVVRHCTQTDTGYLIGIEFEEHAGPQNNASADSASNYYELLQISANAELSTIDRIYRFLATRYHPDNPQTGDPERFIAITRAYDVLSNPDRRAAYDASMQNSASAPSQAFQSIDFMDGIEGELNRRVAVLALLYRQCRTTPDNPRVSLTDLEMKMGFPREYLDFTTWYLRSKKYITREDNSDFALTALGVDFVEENYTKSPILHQLLDNGNGVARKQWQTEDKDIASRAKRRLELESAEALRRQSEQPGRDMEGKQSAGG
jgi:curved DNA-binding protein CbpA